MHYLQARLSELHWRGVRILTDVRIRRVKCDETKPHCIRCTKFGTKCDGYPDIEKKAKSQTRTGPLKIRPWLGPKTQALVAPSRAPLRQAPSIIIFPTETENLYFDAFRKDIIPEISGIWDNSFWDSIVLTACDEPFILDAVLAIAAISLSIKETRTTTRTLEDGTSDPRVSSKHYQFALERFGRAVRTMRSTLTNGEQHLRKALIGCLLVFCFEGFQGYPKQALIHVISGYHLLQSWMIKKSFSLVLPNSTPPVTSLIEKELMDAFNRLYTNAVTVTGDLCSAEAYVLENASGEKVIQNMPQTFADFSEAHRYFVHIMKRCAVFIQVRVIAHLTFLSALPESFGADNSEDMPTMKSAHLTTLTQKPCFLDGCWLTTRALLIKEWRANSGRIGIYHVMGGIDTRSLPQRSRTRENPRNARQAYERAPPMASLLHRATRQHRSSQP